MEQSRSLKNVTPLISGGLHQGAGHNRAGRRAAY